MRSWRMRSSSRSSPAPTGSSSSPRAPPSSVLCGPRPRPRTRPTATLCTSKSLLAPTRLTPCPHRPWRRSWITARSTKTRSGRASTRRGLSSKSCGRLGWTTKTSRRPWRRRACESSPTPSTSSSRGSKIRSDRSSIRANVGEDELMEIGLYGLGRMGANMVLRLVRSGEHRVVAGNRSSGPVDEAVQDGAEGAYSMEELVEKLSPPRAIWKMVPAGDVTEQTLLKFADMMDEGDILIDGGNSYFRDSIRRAEMIHERGLRFLDAGTSGGIWGLQVGYCLMVGGDADAFEHVEPAPKTLAPPDGYAYMGGSGAGHFVKMVLNGVEYGMLQAYAEGFEIMQKSQYDLDLRAVSHLWNQGSVVRSWLLELAERAFERDADLERIRGYVEDSGEGRWTVHEAINEDVPASAIAGSLFARFASRQDDSFAMKVIAALRGEFGGHAIKEAATESEK